MSKMSPVMVGSEEMKATVEGYPEIIGKYT